MSAASDALMAQSLATAKERDAKATQDTDGVGNAANAAFSKFVSTASGGLTDYLEAANRWGKGRGFNVDEVRNDLDKLYAAHPGVSAGAGLAGSVAQWIPTAKAISAVGTGLKLAPSIARLAPALSRAGGSLETAMAAPGLAGGIKSGAITGGVLGTANEAGRQLDRIGSEKSAKEDFNPLGAVGRIGLEAGLGAVGGGVGGLLGDMTKAGQIAKFAPKPVSPAATSALEAADAQAGRVGIGDTLATGKLSAHELGRVVSDPAVKAELAPLAAKFEGMAERAARGTTTTIPGAKGLLPDEVSALAGRQNFTNLRQQATRNVSNTEAAAQRYTPDPLTPVAEDFVHSTPGMAAERQALVTAARNAAINAGSSQADAIAANPMQTVGVLRRLGRTTIDPEVQSGVRQALNEQTRLMPKAGREKPGGGEFKQMHDAMDALEPFNEFWRNLGRKMATPPAEPSKSFSLSLHGGPTTMAKDAALLIRNLLEGRAMTAAGISDVADPALKNWAQVGKRTGAQKTVDPALNSILQFFQGNALKD